MSDEGFAYVDGDYFPLDQAKISVFDRGFIHSDVVYDVTSTWRGRFFRLDEHIARFQRSCAGVRITCRHSTAELKTILANCVVKGGVSEGSYVALVATRGPYDRNIDRTRDVFGATPSFIAYACAYVSIGDEAQLARGFNVIIAKTPRIPDACVDMTIKNYHWGDLTRGKFEAQAAGADTAVHCTIDGFLTEGPGFNLFFVRGGRLYTPARNVLHGITRLSVIDMAKEMDIPCETGDYRANALLEAEEAFVTSTAGGIMAVSRVDDRTYPSAQAGSMTDRLRKEYWRRRDAGWLGTKVESLL